MHFARCGPIYAFSTAIQSTVTQLPCFLFLRRALCDLVASSESRREMAAAAGALPPLVTLLSSTDPTVAQYAAWSICHLSLGSDAVRDGVVAAGGLQALVALLAHPLVRKMHFTGSHVPC